MDGWGGGGSCNRLFLSGSSQQALAIELMFWSLEAGERRPDARVQVVEGASPGRGTSAGSAGVLLPMAMT
jgi:hypothetical protein